MKQQSRLRRIVRGAFGGLGVIMLTVWGVVALTLMAGWVQSTRLGVVVQRDAFGRSLVDETSGKLHVDSVQGRLGLGVDRSWGRNGYGGALARLLGGAAADARWQRTDVPINASFGAAVLGLYPPLPAPATGPVFMSPAPGVVIASPTSSPTGGRPTRISLPAPPPESVARRLGFLWIWHREATPGQSWSYTLQASTPYWAVALMVVVPFPIVLRWFLRRRRSRKRLAAGCCVRCGYDVRVTTSGRCPECGAELEASVIDARRDGDLPVEMGPSPEVATVSS